MLLLFAVCLTSCGTVTMDLTNISSARFLHEDARRNLACDIPVPWVQISRADLEPGGLRTLPAELPRAGFRTGYVRGAEPVPCERQVYQRTDTVFRFDFTEFLTRFRPEQIRLAMLVIDEVPTESDVLIRFAEPWLDSGLDGFTHTGDSTSVPFQVKAVRSDWAPMANSAPAALQGLPQLANLRGRSQITVPLAAGTQPSFVVTDEVRNFLTASTAVQPNFGFAIQPAPERQIQRYKRFNEVKAAFRVRLRLFVSP